MVNASRSSRCLPSPANGSSSAPSSCALPSASISRLRLSGLVGQTRKRCEKHPHFGRAHDLGPSTGKQVTVTSIDIFRIADGKFIERWPERDRLGLLQQLGVVPAPGQAS